jgi:hypothetical protein
MSQISNQTESTTLRSRQQGTVIKMYSIINQRLHFNSDIEDGWKVLIYDKMGTITQ